MTRPQLSHQAHSPGETKSRRDDEATQPILQEKRTRRRSMSYEKMLAVVSQRMPQALG